MHIIKNSSFTLVIKAVLENYRNYSYCYTNLEQFNVIYGNNGSGKTNFLEALSLLSPGKGLRGVNFEEVLNTKNTNLSTTFTIKNDFGTNSIKIINDNNTNKSNLNYLSLNNEEKLAKKVILLDNEPIKKLQQLPLYIKPLWLTPKMDTLFLEENKVQRSFFDRLIFNLDSSHLTRINSYNKALKERNTLLKNQSKDSSWFNALEEILATQGVSIAATRVDFLDKLNQILQKNNSYYFPNIHLSLDGLVERALINDKLSALNCENLIKNKLKDSRAADYKSGTTSLGSHKSIIKIVNLNNKLIAKNCSTGEQKIMLITIILAFVKLLMLEEKINPLLLLDEFLVHLDDKFRNNLLKELTSMPLQFIITTTDIDHFAKFKTKLNFLEVKNNSIF